MGQLEVLDPPLHQQSTAAQHHDILADRLDVGEQVAGEQQAHPLVAGQVDGQVEDVVAARRVHAVGRLVEDQEPRVVHDGGGDLQPLLHPRRVGIAATVPGLAQADVIEHLVGAPKGVAVPHPHQLARIRRRRDPGHPREEALILGDEADGLADGQRLRADVHAQDPAAPRIERDQAQQGPDHRGLARAVGAQQADGPLGHRERQAPQRRHLAVGLGHVLQLDQHRRSRRPGTGGFAHRAARPGSPPPAHSRDGRGYYGTVRPAAASTSPVRRPWFAAEDGEGPSHHGLRTRGQEENFHVLRSESPGSARRTPTPRPGSPHLISLNHRQEKQAVVACNEDEPPATRFFRITPSIHTMTHPFSLFVTVAAGGVPQ